MASTDSENTLTNANALLTYVDQVTTALAKGNLQQTLHLPKSLANQEMAQAMAESFEQITHTLQQAEMRANQLEQLTALQAKLSQAVTEENILSVLAHISPATADMFITLSYIEADEGEEPNTISTVLVWQNDAVEPDHNQLYQTKQLQDDPLAQLWLNAPNQVLFYANVAQDESLSPEIKTFVADIEAQALCIMPLYNGEQWHGVVNFFWTSPYEFSVDERLLRQSILESLAATLANRRTELFQQRLQQQSEQLYQVSRKLNEADDLPAIVSAVAEGIAIPAISQINLFTFHYNNTNDLEMITVDGAWHQGQKELAVPLETRFNKTDFPNIDFYATTDPLILHNIDPDDPLNKDASILYQQEAQESIKAAIVLPLWLGALQMGALTLLSATHDHFSSQEKSVCLAISPQIVAAVDNKRLFTQVRARALQLESASHISQQLAAILSLDPLLETMVTQVKGSFKADYVQIYLLDALKQSLVVHKGTGEVGKNLVDQSYQISLRAENSLLTQAAYGFEPVIINDTKQEVNYKPLPGLAEIRSQVIVPLYSGETLNGLLDIHYQQPNPLDYDAIRTLILIANQFSVNLSNILLFNQVQHRAAQLERLSRIQAALSQAETEADILNAVGTNLDIFSDIQVSLGYLELNEENNPVALIPVSHWPMGHIPLDQPQADQKINLPQDPLSKLWMEQPDNIVYVSDVLTDKRVDETIRAVSQQRGVQAFNIIPLRSGGGRWQGVISFFWPDVHPFNEEEKNLFEQLREPIAAIIASRRALIAQEEARSESEQRAKELTILNELAETLTSRLSLDDILTAAYEGTAKLLDASNFSVGLYDASMDDIYIPFTVSQSQVDRHTTRFPANQGLTGYIIRNKESMLIHNGVAKHLEKLEIPAVGEPSQSFLGVPLLAGAEALGQMSVQNFTTPHAYNEHDQEVLEAVANLTAIAIQTVRQFEASQTLARREQTIREITERMRAAATMEQLVHTATTELGERLAAGHVIINLGLDQEWSTTPNSDTEQL